MIEKIGTLYGIGVGPGDPELLTIKAARVLGQVDLVFTAASPGNDYSIAQQIAQPHLKPGIEVRRLNFPMVGDRETLTRVWRANAEEIAGVLREGLSAAFLTLGDPLTYSTYGYVLPYLAEMLPQGQIRTIPGITSYQMAAARHNQPLVTGLESLTIMSGVEDPEKLGRLLTQTDNVAILKTYRSYEGIVAMLKEKNQLKNATLYSRVGLPDEEIHVDLEKDPVAKPPYLSLMIVKTGGKL
ncbi:MAG: precorrin-2 C(20)-methyltransferase [Candidatus Adiutrix sp.]|jgi:precorrin-2/cobalt-factor-2 C20-methyltransferase|nr:precorrin-2 C(20)-methyltransferase [Candidatus Adiutrix sp.]